MKQNPDSVTNRTYDRIAKQFARNTANIDGNLSQRLERFVQQLRTKDPILDLGCGPGRDLRWFHVNGRSGVGVDLSTGMLHEAQKAVTYLAQADMCHLPFADSCFSGIWCNAALIHISKINIDSVLRDIRRILVPGGAFFVSMQEGCRESVENYQYLGKKRFFARYSMQEMVENLEKAGFSILHKEIYQHKRKWLWFECISTG